MWRDIPPVTMQTVPTDHQQLWSEAAGAHPLPLTIVVLTLNEARDLQDCLTSAAGLAERIVVLDSGSHDATVTLARLATPFVFERPFSGYASQRNAALAYAETPWVLFLDADERLTAAGRAELRGALGGDPADVDGPSGYWIPRRNYFFGCALRGGGWWPDEQLRLFRRDRARYDPAREVHEVLLLEGRAGHLREPLLHRNYDSWREFHAKQYAYARRRAEDLYKHRIHPHPWTYASMPLREWYRRYVTLRAYQDGRLGLALSTLLAWYELVTYTELRRQWLRQGAEVTRAALAAPGRYPRPRIPAGHELVGRVPTLDLSVLVVSHNTRALTERCLRSVLRALDGGNVSYECIVVDHASTDGTVDFLTRHLPGVRIIERNCNPGFAAGVNRGLAAARGSDLLLLNPDTEVSPDAIRHLRAALRARRDIGVVGPRLEFPNGDIQESRRRFPARLTPFFESPLLRPYVVDGRELGRYYVRDRPATEPQEVDWLYGACLLTRREVVADVGGMDESFFLYSEEVDWFRRVAWHGWRVRYVPTAVVAHIEGQSSDATPARRDIAYYSSMVLYHARAHGRWHAELLRYFLLGTFAVMSILEALKWLLGHKRQLRRARVASHWAVLRSRLRVPS